MRQNSIAIFSGLLFGLGLGISEMVNPAKVLGFLDLFGPWDPSLIFVMGFGLLVTLTTFPLILKLDRPLFDTNFMTAEHSIIDGKLIFGAVLFGVGWGLIGFCPGPAIASLAYGKIESVIFLIALFLGLYSDQLYRRPSKLI